MYRDIFKAIDEFTALRFTAIGASPAAKRKRILHMTQHALPISFGMKENNYLVNLYTILCYTAGSAVHAWEFVYDLSAVGRNYQRHEPFVLS
jgi:hypothetical protein